MKFSTEFQRFLRNYKGALICIISFCCFSLLAKVGWIGLLLTVLCASLLLRNEKVLRRSLSTDPALPKYIQISLVSLMVWLIAQPSLFLLFTVTLGIVRALAGKVSTSNHKSLEKIATLTVAILDTRLLLIAALMIGIHSTWFSCQILCDIIPGLPYLAPLIFVPAVFYLGFKLRGLLRTNGVKHAEWLKPELRQILWHDTVFFAFVTICLTTIVWANFAPDGLGDQVAGWLSSSAADANLYKPKYDVAHSPESKIASTELNQIDDTTRNENSSQSDAQLAPSLQMVVQGEVPDLNFPFASLVKVCLTLLFSWVLLPHIIRLSGQLTEFAQKGAFRSARNMPDDFLEVLRRPTKELVMEEPVPWLHNAAVTFWWLIGCYAVLFFLVAACPGPLGAAIINWIDASLCDAQIGYVGSAGFSVVNFPQLRLYIAALFAMVGAVPLAVSGCVFLPAFKPKSITLTSKGLSFTRGPFVQILWRPNRLWCDLRKVRFARHGKNTKLDDRRLVFEFRSGGSLDLKLSQLSREDLQILLCTIDEHSENCVLTEEVVALRRELVAIPENECLPEEKKFRGLPAAQFKSTIFAPFSPGDCLPDSPIRVVRLLASKQLSAVYLVRLEDSRLAVAKQFSFPKSSETYERLFEKFQREHQLLQKLEHPFIARVLDVRRDSNTGFIILEHFKGRDLSAVVNEDGVRSEEETIAIAKKICQVMTYLHAQSVPIIHRDLTPDNLLIDENADLRLIDFGAAHQFLEGITGTLIGKQCYVAPEQLRGEASLRSDIYSFGCVLHYLLTGLEPLALSQSDPGLHVKVSAGLRQIIMNCTEFEQDARAESFEQLLVELNGIQSGQSADQSSAHFGTIELGPRDRAMSKIMKLRPKDLVVKLLQPGAL